jgi:fatty-acyl-CoA synthase
LEKWSPADCYARALRAAGGLRRIGVAHGDRVAMAIPNSLDGVACVLGAWLLGACVVSLPMPARGMDAACYARQMRRIVTACAPTAVVGVDPSFSTWREARSTQLAELVASSRRPVRPDPPGPEAAAFVQYSSGTTGTPKGCVLTAGAIARQLGALAESLSVDPRNDGFMSWLPLSHDMGLFGCLLLAYWTGAPITLAAPQRFARRPSSWLQDCSRAGATITAGPNFALELAARSSASRPCGPLVLRHLVIGGERVHAVTLERALHAFEPMGLRWSTLRPAYGMAEAVLAVSMTSASGPRIESLDADALSDGQLALPRPGGPPEAAIRVVSAGRPLPGFAVRAVGPSDCGELLVRAPSLARGYLGDTPATAARFQGGEFATHDLGFLHEGEVFPLERIDDVIIVGGRKLHVGELEQEVTRLHGVRAGNCAIIQVTTHGGSPQLVALVERDGDCDASARSARDIRRMVRNHSGATVAQCLFVPRGTLPKTPSGKLQRHACRQLALARLTR